MNEYLKSNQGLWDRWAELHEKSEFYDVGTFKAGRNTLHGVEREELGNVEGKSLLHLQCHFGMDTLSLARLGAVATGVDFSEKAIEIARALSAETAIPATFVHSDVYDLPENLSGQFDIVFTSYGVIWWLPDLQAWARVISHFLKPGGTFLIVESHPTAMLFDEEQPAELRVKYSYFAAPEPLKFEVHGSYAAADPDYEGVEYGWNHDMGEILNSLIAGGLEIESLREFPFVPWRMYSFMEKGEDEWWRLPPGMPEIPLMFSLKARNKG